MSDARQQEMLAELAELQAQNRARKLRTAQAMRVGSLVVGLSFVFLLRGDIRYALQPATPVDLGGPLEFNLQPERTELFARVTGVPAQQAANVSHHGNALRVFGLLGTNILVVQDLSKTAPDQVPSSGAPFHGEGRLRIDDDAVELRNIFGMMERAGYVSAIDGHLFALYLDEPPRQGWALPAELIGIVLFVLANWRAAHNVAKSAEPSPGDAVPPVA